MPCRGWEGVVGVMPTFPEAKDSKKHVVATFVIALKWLPPPDMTDRIDAPGNVVDEQHPNQSAPDKASPGAAQRSNQEPANRSWQQQTDNDPQREHLADKAQYSDF